MRIRVRQRREVAVALPQGRVLGLAGSATLPALMAIAYWRLRRPRLGDEAERWLSGEG
jgi:hypothetical protein